MDTGLELWGGLECTVNRVGTEYFDQLSSLDDVSPEDLVDTVATLGIKKLRVPVLWERVAPNGLKSADWGWTDRVLARLRRHGIAPIAGLLHHGSGPRETSLTDRRFPERFARFAEAAVLRYPWIEHFTPINEPLTTARFSALYGLWYPHASDERVFATALLRQCAGSCAAMAAIKNHVPHACFVQTEDLGKCYATAHMQYQADLENLRRWASLDALCGFVESNAVLQRYIALSGHTQTADFFCPPDIIGFNYYVTSERWLDERLARYPVEAHGGNGKDAYADVAVARVCVEGTAGVAKLLGEAAERYRIPLAITESHLGCTREEQLRWLSETYEETASARSAGCDVRAFTFWALCGSRDWNVLLTHRTGHYEVGAFDQRSRPLRATAIARFMRALNDGAATDAPAMRAPGWWRRIDRLEHPPIARSEPLALPPRKAVRPRQQPVLILGGGGRLAAAIETAARTRALAPVPLSRAACDITDSRAVARAFEEYRPWAVINAAGSPDVDVAQCDFGAADAVHFRAPVKLAAQCNAHGVALVSFSTDNVFNNADDTPATESMTMDPVNTYGIIKGAADNAILATYPQALVVRAGRLVGLRNDPIADVMRALESGQRVRIASDERFSAAYAAPFVDAVLDLLIDEEEGLWHVTDGAKRSWHDVIATLVSPALVRGLVSVAGGSLHRPAPRPRYCVLGSQRGILLDDFTHTARRFQRQRTGRTIAQRSAEA